MKPKLLPVPSQCSTPEVGVDYYGDDISNFAGMKLPEECCNKCTETSGFAAFTFINHGWDGQTHCYLKSGTGTKKSVANAVSAIVSSSSCSTSNGGYCGNSKGTSCCPSNTYCQPWNSDYSSAKMFQPSARRSTRMWISGATTWVSALESTCSETAGCVGYTFVNTDSRGPACYLKSSLYGKRSSVGAVSGVVNSPLVVNTSTHIQAKIRSGVVKSKAVNLGGWLVSENWMSWESPLWTDVSSDEVWRGEYNLMRILGKTKGTAAFEEHRKTWITETDIKEIADTGVLNTVRVPVGYWIVRDATAAPGTEGDVYAPGGLKNLDSLINEWAVKYNLAVIISLQAHQGSQNGYEHSSPVTIGTVGWSTSQTNIDNSLVFASFLAARYKNSEAFLGIALMNEPMSPVDRTALQNYYIETYKIRATGNKCILLVSPFLGEQDAGHLYGMISAPQYENVWNEIHAYFIWGYDGVSKEQILAQVDKYDETHLKAAPTSNRLYGAWEDLPIRMASFRTWTTSASWGRSSLTISTQTPLVAGRSGRGGTRTRPSNGQVGQCET